MPSKNGTSNFEKLIPLLAPIGIGIAPQGGEVAANVE